jgi:hypothetical protein
MVPVTLTVYVPGGVFTAEIVMDEMPDPPGDSVMVAGLKEIVGRLVTTGETVALRPMVPPSPLLLISETTSWALDPLASVTEVANAMMRRSTT